MRDLESKLAYLLYKNYAAKIEHEGKINIIERKCNILKDIFLVIFINKRFFCK